VELAAGVPGGGYKTYKCKNNLWDVATPIMVGEHHLGNIYTGQFFFEDDPPDRELFRQQARRYGFDETEYLEALERTPRLSREMVETAMSFYTKLAALVSSLSLKSLHLARAGYQKDRAFQQQQAAEVEQQAAEAALRESEERHRRLFETITHGVVYHDHEGRIVAANSSAERIIGLSLDQMRGVLPHSSVRKLLCEDGSELAEAEHPVAKALATAATVGPVVLGLSLPRDDKASIVWLRMTAIPLLRPGEQRPYQVYSVFEEITEQKLAEQQIYNLVQEKETLLQEVLHRIKNNMITMTSLLSLQMDAVVEPAVKLALADTLGRFRSMQVLYENLYSIGAGSSVSIMEYLRAVTEQVLPLFAIAEKVSCTVVLDEPEDEQAALCVLDAKRLSTLGLIVNELLTNSMKHAFRKLDRGVLELRVRCANGRIEVTVCDNGPGLPAGLEPGTSTGLGLSLVQALAEQLQGSMCFEKGSGMRAVLEFPQDV